MNTMKERRIAGGGVSTVVAATLVVLGSTYTGCTFGGFMAAFTNATAKNSNTVIPMLFNRGHLPRYLSGRINEYKSHMIKIIKHTTNNIHNTSTYIFIRYTTVRI